MTEVVKNAETKSLVTLDDLVAASSDVEYTEIPGFKDNQFFRIRSLTAGDLIEWHEAGEDERAKRTAGLRLIVKSLVDKAGQRILTNESIGMLKNISVKISERVVEEILKHNGMNVKGGKTKAETDAKNG